MREITLKKLFEIVDSPFVLNTTMTVPYIEYANGDFVTEYKNNKASYDRYFLKEHGKKTVELESEEDEDIIVEWHNLISDIQRVYTDAWTHQFANLNIAYNPVFNVTEDTETTYGEHETEMEYGLHETENQYGQHETDHLYGATSDTLGTHTDTSTSYAVGYESGTEKETGKVSDTIGSQTNTSLSHTDTTTSKIHTDTTTDKLHTDTNTSKQHIDSIHREGNIGTVSSSKLLTEEMYAREKFIFFKSIFLTIVREVGAYYDCELL